MSFPKQQVPILLLFLFSIVNTGCNESKVWQEPFPDRLTISAVDSIGIEMGDSCYVLGSIADADFSGQGNILLLDQSAACIRRYTSGGVFMNCLSGRGNGPGELSIPTEMAVLSDGSIIVIDPIRTAMIRISDTGEKCEDMAEFSLTTPNSVSTLADSSYCAWEISFQQQGDDFILMVPLGLYSTSGTNQYLTLSTDTLNQEQMTKAFSSISGMSAMRVVASNNNDRVYHCRKSISEYAVDCWNSSGTHLFTASLPLSLVEKTAGELDLEKEYSRMLLASYGSNSLPEGWEPEPFHNLVDNIGVDSEGNLWVQRGTEPNPVFDVFDTDGVHVATAEYPRVGKSWQFRITPNGTLAWNNDPLSGVQKLYMIDLPVLSR